jgi:hypothetical protein
MALWRDARRSVLSAWAFQPRAGLIILALHKAVRRALPALPAQPAQPVSLALPAQPALALPSLPALPALPALTELQPAVCCNLNREQAPIGSFSVHCPALAMQAQSNIHVLIVGVVSAVRARCLLGCLPSGEGSMRRF